MSDIGKALNKLMLTLYNSGLRAPWLLTGIRSVPEYLHYLPNGLEYRKNAPGYVCSTWAPEACCSEGC